MRTPSLAATVLVALLPALPPLAAGCGGGAVDLQKALEVADVVTGWYDAGIVNGKNKLVPSMSFRLKNVSTETIAGVQVMLSYRRVVELEIEWGSSFAKAIDAGGLAPGQTGAPIVLRSELGYTGEQPRAQMLQNKEFVDARIRMFLKQGSSRWVKMGEFPVARQLLTRQRGAVPGTW